MAEALPAGITERIRARTEQAPSITTATVEKIMSAVQSAYADLLKGTKSPIDAQRTLNDLFGLDRSMLTLALKDFGLTYEFREMDIDSQLKIDSTYQRGETSIIRIIAERFDPLAFGVVWVGNRNGEFYVVDGQQRTKGAQLAGHSKVPAVVFMSQGRAQEADIFRKLNAWRKKVTRMDIFRAALQADVTYAKEISMTVNSLGFEIDLSRKMHNVVWPKIQAIGALEDIHAIAGQAGVERVLQTIGTCWEGQANALINQYLKAVYQFHSTYGDALDEERMTERFPRRTASEIMLAAENDKAGERRRTGATLSLNTCVLNQLRKLYGRKPPNSEPKRSNEADEEVGE